MLRTRCTLCAWRCVSYIKNTPFIVSLQIFLQFERQLLTPKSNQLEAGTDQAKLGAFKPIVQARKAKRANGKKRHMSRDEDT